MLILPILFSVIKVNIGKISSNCTQKLKYSNYCFLGMLIVKSLKCMHIYMHPTSCYIPLDTTTTDSHRTKQAKACTFSLISCNSFVSCFLPTFTLPTLTSLKSFSHFRKRSKVRISLTCSDFHHFYKIQSLSPFSTLVVDTFIFFSMLLLHNIIYLTFAANRSDSQTTWHCLNGKLCIHSCPPTTTS